MACGRGANRHAGDASGVGDRLVRLGERRSEQAGSGARAATVSRDVGKRRVAADRPSALGHPWALLAAYPVSST